MRFRKLTTRACDLSVAQEIQAERGVRNTAWRGDIVIANCDVRRCGHRSQQSEPADSRNGGDIHLVPKSDREVVATIAQRPCFLVLNQQNRQL
jgi:hypothetical protein